MLLIGDGNCHLIKFSEKRFHVMLGQCRRERYFLTIDEYSKIKRETYVWR